MSTLAAPTRKRATRLRELPGIAVAANGKVGEEHLLGRQSMYSLPDEPVSGAKFMRSWAHHGLDVDALPEARQKVDVFRSACASVKERKATDPRTGQRIEILANEVVSDGSAYQITVRRWNLAEREIEHEKSMRIEFDKRTNGITMAALESFDPAMGKLLTQIQDHFDANASTVPGQKVRNAVRQTLLEVGAQNLRRKAGGVYFVPRQKPESDVPTLPILEGLAGVLADLYGDRADFDVLKIANDDGARQIVAKHFGINATDKATELAEKAWGRVRQGRGERGVRADLIANLENERRALLGQVKHFEELVNFERSDIDEALSELDEALSKLDDLANEPAPTT